MIEQFWFYSRGPNYNVEGFESISSGHAASMQGWRQREGWLNDELLWLIAAENEDDISDI